MFQCFVKKFIKNHEDTDNVSVRQSYGKLVSVIGIVLNVVLSALKIVAGIIVGAISVVSDGVNNLSDAGSSVITLLGFKLSAKKPDKDHPFGHGRMEYFAGLAVSIVIITVAVSLFSEALQKVVNGVTSEASSDRAFYLTLGILICSISVKLWMALLNRKVGRRIASVAMQATFYDCISDCVSTLVVLLCHVVSKYVGDFPIDGVAGIAVSVFIAYTGVRSLKDVADLLLGKAPDAALIKEIETYVKDYDDRVVGVHDIMVHDYGPGRKIVIMHTEVPVEGNIRELHDMVDNIENGLAERFNCIATIHMDPVTTTSERVNCLREKCREIVKSIDADFDIHDFRVVEGDTHSNLIFDLLLTHETKLTPDDVVSIFVNELKKYDHKLVAKIKAEYPLV